MCVNQCLLCSRKYTGCITASATGISGAHGKSPQGPIQGIVAHPYLHTHTHTHTHTCTHTEWRVIMEECVPKQCSLCAIVMVPLVSFMIGHCKKWSMDDEVVHFLLHVNNERKLIIGTKLKYTFCTCTDDHFEHAPSLLKKHYCTIFPRISARVLISYRASKTRRLNETRRLFVTRRLFLIAYFEGTVDL